MSEVSELDWMTDPRDAFTAGVLVGVEVFTRPFKREWLHDDGAVVHSTPVVGCAVCEVIAEELAHHIARGTLIDEDAIAAAVNKLPSPIARATNADGSLRKTSERVVALMSDGKARTAREVAGLLQLSIGGVKGALRETCDVLPRGARPEKVWRIRSHKSLPA